MPRGDPEEPRRDGEAARRRRGPPVLGWFTQSLVRTLVTLLGLVLLVFAVGQAFGLELLGATVEFLATETGMWLLVALFALMLIVAAQRSYVYYHR